MIAGGTFGNGVETNRQLVMRIIHIMKYALHGAGNVYAAIDLACTQAKLGHKVYVCSSVSDFDDLLRKHDVEFIHVNQSGSVAVSGFALVKLFWRLRALKPDIVHAHMMKSALLAAILRPILGFKLVTTVHNEFQKSAIAMRVGQRVIGVSEAVTQSMIQRGIAPAKMRTVPNGTINSPRRPLPAPMPMALQHPAIVTIAGMHPRKGIVDLMHASVIVAERFPTAHLYLVGTGPMHDEYKQLANTLRPNGITFCGHLDDPRPVLLAADVFVLASHSEPAALVLSEAREAGCAIVATDVGGNREMLSNGEAGVLVPPKNPAALADAIIGLLDDPAHMATMRANSTRDLYRFTMERVAADIEQVYRELVPSLNSV
jgi:glycosyltransferase involved in cell wall biosynthesis